MHTFKRLFALMLIALAVAPALAMEPGDHEMTDETHPPIEQGNKTPSRSKKHRLTGFVGHVKDLLHKPGHKVEVRADPIPAEKSLEDEEHVVVPQSVLAVPADDLIEKESVELAAEAAHVVAEEARVAAVVAEQPRLAAAQVYLAEAQADLNAAPADAGDRADLQADVHAEQGEVILVTPIEVVVAEEVGVAAEANAPILIVATPLVEAQADLNAAPADAVNRADLQPATNEAQVEVTLPTPTDFVQEKTFAKEDAVPAKGFYAWNPDKPGVSVAKYGITATVVAAIIGGSYALYNYLFADEVDEEVELLAAPVEAPVKTTLIAPVAQVVVKSVSNNGGSRSGRGCGKRRSKNSSVRVKRSGKKDCKKNACKYILANA
jgi:hypothetical protein